MAGAPGRGSEMPSADARGQRAAPREEDLPAGAMSWARVPGRWRGGSRGIARRPGRVEGGRPGRRLAVPTLGGWGQGRKPTHRTVHPGSQPAFGRSGQNCDLQVASPSSVGRSRSSCYSSDAVPAHGAQRDAFASRSCTGPRLSSAAHTPKGASLNRPWLSFPMPFKPQGDGVFKFPALEVVRLRGFVSGQQREHHKIFVTKQAPDGKVETRPASVRP